jgi:hypothetical protein
MKAASGRAASHTSAQERHTLRRENRPSIRQRVIRQVPSFAGEMVSRMLEGYGTEVANQAGWIEPR